jgi:hypothetical protein
MYRLCYRRFGVYLRKSTDGVLVLWASCVGVGKGSMTWSEEELKALEIAVVGGFARGCQAGGITQFSLLSADSLNFLSLIKANNPNHVDDARALADA